MYYYPQSEEMPLELFNRHTMHQLHSPAGLDSEIDLENATNSRLRARQKDKATESSLGGMNVEVFLP